MSELEVSRRAPGRTLGWILFWWGVLPAIVWGILTLFYRFRAYRRDRIPRSGPVLYVSNHQAYLDLMAVGLLIRDRPFTPMGKANLWKPRLMRFIMNGFRSIAVERGGGANLAAMKAALKELEAGRCILIFPEGHRSTDGLMRPFERGVMLLIKRAKAALVVPIAIEGTFDLWPRGRTLPRLTGDIQVMAGEAIATTKLAAMGEDEALDHLRRTIESMRIELRARIRCATSGAHPPPGPGDVPYWEREARSENPACAEPVAQASRL